MTTRRQRHPLFELCGVVPLGVYALVHASTYATLLFGHDPNGRPASASFTVTVLEWLLVWLPLGFHGGYGLVLSFQRLAPDAEQRQRTLLLRASGIASLAFIVGHALWLKLPLWRGERLPSDTLQMLASGLGATTSGVPITAALHVLGVATVAAHLGFGLERFLDDYGILGARRARGAATLVATTLFVIATATVVHLAAGSALPNFLH